MINVLLYWPALHPIFSYWDGQSGIWIVRSVEIDLRRWTLAVAVMTVDAYPFVYLVIYHKISEEVLSRFLEQSKQALWALFGGKYLNHFGTLEVFFPKILSFFSKYQLTVCNISLKSPWNRSWEKPLINKHGGRQTGRQTGITTSQEESSLRT